MPVRWSRGDFPGAEIIAPIAAAAPEESRRGDTHLGGRRERKVRRGLVLLDAVILFMLPCFFPSLLWLEHLVLRRFAVPGHILPRSSRRHCSVAGGGLRTRGFAGEMGGSGTEAARLKGARTGNTLSSFSPPSVLRFQPKLINRLFNDPAREEKIDQSD
jgi:hypothetical protein